MIAMDIPLHRLRAHANALAPKDKLVILLSFSRTNKSCLHNSLLCPY